MAELTCVTIGLDVGSEGNGGTRFWIQQPGSEEGCRGSSQLLRSRLVAVTVTSTRGQHQEGGPAHLGDGRAISFQGKSVLFIFLSLTIKSCVRWKS